MSTPRSHDDDHHDREDDEDDREDSADREDDDRDDDGDDDEHSDEETDAPGDEDDEPVAPRKPYRPPLKNSIVPSLLFAAGALFLTAFVNLRYPGAEPRYWYFAPSLDIVIIFMCLAWAGQLGWRIPKSLFIAAVVWLFSVRFMLLLSRAWPLPFIPRSARSIARTPAVSASPSTRDASPTSADRARTRTRTACSARRCPRTTPASCTARGGCSIRCAASA
jgi:hypothetical protein